MRAFIDTNIFVYATSTKFAEHIAAKKFLRDSVESSNYWYLSWGIIYEYLRVVTHPKIFPEGPLSLARAVENVSRFVNSPQVEVLQETSDHIHHLATLGKDPQSLRGSILHDVHTVLLMQEHDVGKIYTADTDFHRFQGIEVVNPLSSALHPSS